MYDGESQHQECCVLVMLLLVPEQRQQVPTDNAYLLRWACKQLLMPLRVRRSHMAKLHGGRSKRLTSAHALADRDSLYSGRWWAWYRQPSS